MHRKKNWKTGKLIKYLYLFSINNYMPWNNRKSYRKKKTYTKKKKWSVGKTRIGKPSKGLKQSIYFFKRRTVDVIELNNQLPPDGWSAGAFNSIYKQHQYSLTDVREDTDFSNLFLQYKISAVKVSFMFSNTVAGAVGTSGTPPMSGNNSQIVVMYAPWVHGNTYHAPDANYMKDTQASKRKLALNGGKPISLYMPVKQLSIMHAPVGSGTVDYAAVNPKWISTRETSTPHYGLNICFQRADRAIFAHESAQYQSCRVETTYYIACKGVH